MGALCCFLPETNHLPLPSAIKEAGENKWFVFLQNVAVMLNITYLIISVAGYLICVASVNQQKSTVSGAVFLSLIFIE